MVIERVPCLRLNVPDLFAEGNFVDWLNAGSGHSDRTQNFPKIATWHRFNRSDPPGEYADVFVTYDGGEGSDSPVGNGAWPSGSGMPEAAWERLCGIVEEETGSRQGCYLLWLTNLEE
jgi:hypothetical protein